MKVALLEIHKSVLLRDPKKLFKMLIYAPNELKGADFVRKVKEVYAS